MKTLMILTLLPVLLGAVGAGLAQETAAGPIELRAVAEVETAVPDSTGALQVQRRPADKVVPGDEVIFTLYYRNTGGDAVENVFITNPIPEHMEFQAAEFERDGLEVTFSVDGGRSFGALSQLLMTTADGSRRPATRADCTHIRWIFDQPLQPGEKGQVRYTAQLL